SRSANATQEGSSRTVAGGLLPLGEWAHFVVVTSGTNGRNRNMYKNGVQVLNATSNQGSNDINAVTRTQNFIGRALWPDANLDGAVDEVRIASAGRSAGWVKLEYANQQRVHTLTDIGAPPPDAPTAPTDVFAIADAGQAFVEWSAPEDDGRSPITGYTVTGTPGGNCAVNGTARSCTIPGLTNGTSYTFTVRATNAVGNSPVSAASNSVTPTAITTTNYSAWTQNATITLNTSSTGANVPGGVT